MTGEPKPVELVAVTELSPVLAAIAVAPPALTRLEPQSVSGDPAPGAVAAVADPLWMLGRQWQLGELLGEDVGTPVSVMVTSRSLPVTAWAAAGDLEPAAIAQQAEWQPWPEGAVLDELVEHVPDAGAEQGLRWRAETGAQLAELLREAGQGGAADLLLAAHPLVLPADPADPTGSLDPGAARMFLVLEGRVPDGAAARTALEAGEPSWVADAADPGTAGSVAAEWLAWVAGQPGAGGAWSTPRLEHRFALRFGSGGEADSAVVAATAFGTGAARWHDLQWLEGWTVALDGDADLPAVPAVTDTMLATPLRYPGMPSTRYWQLEDGSVDVAAIEAQPHDLARLCLAEFALVGGDDWLLVPVDGRVGALNQVQRVTVTTTFGETYDIAEDGTDRRRRGFGMFEVTSEGGTVLPGVLLPPVANTPLAGDPVEEVAFVRDETANMAWAVERVVPGRSGDPRQRSAEPQPTRPAAPEDLADGDLLYELLSPVPAHWIPLVPVSTGYAEVGLRKGALLSADEQPVLAASTLLRPTPLTFPGEEIPREGVTVTAVPLLARRRDGSYARWTGHRVRVGRGEGSSGFASDTARETRVPGG
jgi:hypothetical protein